MIEIGESVRNGSGYIHKIDSLNKLSNFYKDEEGNIRELVGETVFGADITEIITKHNKNIIKLVETGDYVDGYKILELKKAIRQNDTIYICIYKDTEHTIWRTINDNNIKSILTKEQYKANAYKIGE